MKVILLGAGRVGRAVVEALHSEHELTVIDQDPERLDYLADRYDVMTVEGNGTTKRPTGSWSSRRPPPHERGAG